MLIAEKPMVRAFGTCDILLLRSKKSVQVAALKYHKQKKLKYFECASLASAGFSGDCTAILTDAALREQPAYVEGLYGIHKADV